MEQNSHQLIECNACLVSFPVSDIKIYPRIVSKANQRAIAYCFKCPECGQEYVCYFKDSEVNALFRKGKPELARQRMACLKEIFTNDSSV